MENHVALYLCVYRQDFSTQLKFSSLVENFRKILEIMNSLTLNNMNSAFLFFLFLLHKIFTEVLVNERYP